MSREPLFDFGAFWPPEWLLQVGAAFCQVIENPRQEASALPLVASVGPESVWTAACDPKQTPGKTLVFSASTKC